MTVRVEYWLSVASPWTWLGSARFMDLLARTGAQVELLPMDLSEVFAATGGTPFPQRSPARQSYRQLELARWSRKLGVPLTLTPRYYPVDRVPASCLLIAAGEAGLDTLTLSHAVLRAIWCEDRDIADWATLVQLVEGFGHDGEALVKQAQHPNTVRQLGANTQRAVQSGVFGAPTFIVDGERFWGQDRLDVLEERLSRA
ncbi:2-hydroxychromene-2-carboxylate isomerase [Hydrogenophaga palleronii]|uniref:2-hydroxychromene-2-carboxylate isomerase n=1 Tax=Hydrogenophaga palleronii TaxID=65655 RepID=UPI0008265456|nr:2-hydroxychromene-2-carboxylate isomerase [Hydrogenophaga palleronii]